MSDQETPTDILIERLISRSGEPGYEWLAEVAERLQTLRGYNREMVREVIEEFWSAPVTTTTSQGDPPPVFNMEHVDALARSLNTQASMDWWAEQHGRGTFRDEEE